jgi:electron transfer flavoprotein beta subunit
MNILVCVKQVPHVEDIVVQEKLDGVAVLGAFDEFAMNRFDEFAVEQAVQFKSAMPHTRIDAVTVGPRRALDVIKRAIGMGCDEGVHLQTDTDEDPGPPATAAWIAQYAQAKTYDLILCGSMSEDGMHGQVGPMLAAHLGMAYATQVIAARFLEVSAALDVEREIEGGSREMVEITLPALLALQPGINRPRYPSLSNLLGANRQAMEVVPVETLSSPDRKASGVTLKAPRHRRASEVITGPASEKAEKMIALLKAKALI